MSTPSQKSTPLEKVPLRKFRSIEEIVDAIVDGHATKKHLHEFADMGITTKHDLKQHLRDALISFETACFSAYYHIEKSPADFFYHAKTNTYIVIPYEHEKEPTTCRPPNFEKQFEKKLEKAHEISPHLESIKLCYGISELHPDLRIKETILLNEKLTRNNP